MSKQYFPLIKKGKAINKIISWGKDRGGDYFHSNENCCFHPNEIKSMNVALKTLH